MQTIHRGRPNLGNVLGLVAGALLLSSAAVQAGECPADQVGVDVTLPGAEANAGATDMVLASIDLGEQATDLPDHKFRMRQIEIEPDGEVAWQSHDERPAIIYIISGEMTEYRSTCGVPIVHKTGEVAAEVKGDSHWWKNTGGDKAVLISADIVHDPSDKNM